MNGAYPGEGAASSEWWPASRSVMACMPDSRQAISKPKVSRAAAHATNVTAYRTARTTTEVGRARCQDIPAKSRHARGSGQRPPDARLASCRARLPGVAVQGVQTLLGAPAIVRLRIASEQGLPRAP